MHPSQHYMLTQCRFNFGPASATLAQHWNDIGLAYSVCRVTIAIKAILMYYKINGPTLHVSIFESPSTNTQQRNCVSYHSHMHINHIQNYTQACNVSTLLNTNLDINERAFLETCTHINWNGNITSGFIAATVIFTRAYPIHSYYAWKTG